MKNKLSTNCIFFLLTIFITTICISQHTKKIQVPGTRIFIDEQQNFDLQGMSPVLIEKKGFSSIIFAEIPRSLEDVLNHYTSKNKLDDDSWTMVNRPKPFEIHTYKGYILNFQKSFGLIEQEYVHSQIFISGDSVQSFSVAVNYHDSTQYKHNKLLLSILNTLQWKKDDKVDLMDMMKFTFQPKKSFKLISRNINSILYSSSALPIDSSLSIPFFNIKILFSRWNDLQQKEKKKYFENILEEIHPYIHVIKVVEFSNINLDGIDGYEATAEGINLYNDSASGVYLAIIFHPVGYLGFIGITPKESRDENIETFKEMTRTFQRKKLDQINSDECYDYIRSKRYKEAEQCYNALIKKDSLSIVPLLGKAQLSLILKKYKESITLFDIVIRLDKTLESAYVGRAKAYVLTEKYLNAIYDYDKAIELNGKELDYFTSRAKAKMLFGNGPGAALDYEKAIAFSPKEMDYYLLYAEASSSASQHSNSITMLLKAITLDSSNAKIYQKLGDIFFEMERYKESLTYYDRAVKLKANTSEVYYQRSLTKVNLDDITGALNDATKAIQIHNSFSDGYLLRGRIKMYLGKISEAVEDFSKARKIDTREDDALFYGGIAQLFLGKYKPASNDIRNSMGLRYGLSSRIWLFLAEAKGYNYSAAKKNLASYLQQATSKTPYTFDLAGIKYALGEISADEYIRQVNNGVQNSKHEYSEKRKKQELGEAYFVIGIIEFMSGSKFSSKKSFQKCIDLLQDGGFDYQIAKAIVNGSIR